tara:strand:+ start:318 stop:1139 length:822 start_codon:yes stop_codon:yes gene_type:complete
MEKYLVVGNPIDHSLSPQLHNYWLQKNNINGIYNKQKLSKNDLEHLIVKIKNKEIAGVNVTVPFKKEIISYLDELTLEADKTQSVNTVLLLNNKVIGHNTDVSGFEKAIKDTKYNLSGKKTLILGAGGVVSSIILALFKMKVFSVTISNRTKAKAENLRDYYNSFMSLELNQSKIEVLDWGEIKEFDMIINATSVGLKNGENLDLDLSKVGKNKFFYDLIYNPKETNFLRMGRKFGNKTENGKKMFVYQAAQAFKIWHDIQPEINDEVNKLLD